MVDRLSTFFKADPFATIEWVDDYSPARGWLVLNSLRGGAAGGGTRMRAGCTQKEVQDLAKTMEIKFAISGPAIGGAKSGIDYDFADDEDKRSVLRRWFSFIEKELKTHYGTGGDQNVDQRYDVIPILEELGIRHPQEGIVSGHHPYLSATEHNKIVDQLRQGVLCPIERDPFLRTLGFTIADVATGYGVVESISLYYNSIGSSIAGKEIILEGLGNVGGAAAYYAMKHGAIVTGVIEKEWVLFDERGIDVPALLRAQRDRQVDAAHFSQLRTTPTDAALPRADIFVPAATSATIDEKRIDALLSAGVSVLSCGANNPFTTSAVVSQADATFSIIPDFVANAGMARVFSYLMQPGVEVSELAILADIKACMASFMVELFYRQTDLHHLIATAEEIVVDRMEETA